tara:strand:+ start:129 stop:1055 length:927 start_codon:yes stop_codon:yes gene_type:complete
MENKAINKNKEEIDLSEFFYILWNRKKIILSSTIFFFLLAMIYSFTLPNIYHSKAILNPTSEENDVLNQAMKNYGGLASLAGINLSPQSSDNNSVKALEKLSSLSFFSENILPNIFLPDLMALKSWSSENNKIFYNNDYNEETQKWVRDFKFPQNQVPSAQESFEIFKEQLTVTQDQQTGFITIGIKHESPYISQAWTELLVEELNYYFREKDKKEAEAATDYLYAQIAKTNFVEVKEAIAEILSSKTQQLALIEVSDFYVFGYIDPPVVMEEKSEPSRVILSLFGALIGFSLAVVLVLTNYFQSKKN